MRGPDLVRSSGGGWSSAAFIVGTEVLERLAYYGILVNLISYLTGPLGESTAAAAANVNAWSGVSLMFTLLGGLIGDSFGRYRTAVFSSFLYVLGLAMLAGTAAGKDIWLPSRFQTAFFFSALYLVALAQGGHKPCVQAFAADQFDGDSPEECRCRSSFFNWMYFGVSGGSGITILLMPYAQENIGWGLGFGLPCAAMAIASVLFLAGTRTYRFCGQSSTIPREVVQEENEPLLASGSPEATFRGVIRLLPIWATCLLYAVVFAQSSTFFTKQGGTMDRRISSSFLVPPAALQSFISLAVLASLPAYDQVFVPIARSFTGQPSGVTMLQRIGIGMFLSISAMVTAAVVEKKRLRIARDAGLVDRPGSTIPMSLWWLLPQYILYGISDVFTVVGLQEFFYDQVPNGLRSLGLALYLSIFGIGSFASSFLILMIKRVSAGCGDDWFSDNLNRAHLDYFYMLLAVLSTVAFLLYVYFARSFRYKEINAAT